MTSSETAAEHRLFTEVWRGGVLEEHLHAVYADGSARGAPVRPSPGARLTYTKVARARACGRVSRAADSPARSTG